MQLRVVVLKVRGGWEPVLERGFHLSAGPNFALPFLGSLGIGWSTRVMHTSSVSKLSTSPSYLVGCLCNQRPSQLYGTSQEISQGQVFLQTLEPLFWCQSWWWWWWCLQPLLFLGSESSSLEVLKGFSRLLDSQYEWPEELATSDRMAMFLFLRDSPGCFLRCSFCFSRCS